MTILFFGDSITWGAWDSDGGWVSRIKRKVDEKIISSNFEYYNDIYNVGISGDNTGDLLNRFELETKSRMEENEETSFVFAIGVNDSQYIEGEGNRIPIDKFKDNLKELISKARKYESKIVFVGLFPTDDSKLNPTPWGDNKSYKLEYVEKYNETIKNVCQSENIDFIDIYSQFINKDYKKLLIDGLHPNSEGHKQISEIVSNFLKEKNFT